MQPSQHLPQRLPVAVGIGPQRHTGHGPQQGQPQGEGGTKGHQGGAGIEQPPGPPPQLPGRRGQVAAVALRGFAAGHCRTLGPRRGQN
jgi:hypothetical protein